jgi:hypothetical protein
MSSAGDQECALLGTASKVRMSDVKTKLVVGAIVLLGSFADDASSGLKIRVTPTVAIAPTDVIIYAFVERRPDNRLLRVRADSGDFLRSSDVQLEGEKSARLTIIRFPQVPAGWYDVEAVLIGSNGRTISVARARINVLS